MENAQSAGPVRQVQALLCHRDTEMALVTLGSLVSQSEESLAMVIHDDGSLTTEDTDRLVAELGARVIGRAEADELMADQLSNWPLARAFRAGGPAYALKLLDCCLLADGEVNYIDSDILFYRPFSGLFDPPPGVNALMMCDIRDAYSLSIVSWPTASRWLPSRLNGGLVHFALGAYDLDYVEHFLSKRRYNALPLFTEQTCIAALAKRAAVHSYDPRQIRLVTDGSAERPAIAGHYTTPFRSLLPAAVELAADPARQPEDTVRVMTREAPPARFADVAWSTSRYNLGVKKHRLEKRLGLRTIWTPRAVGIKRGTAP